MKKGKALERLVEHIERTVFADAERVKIESPGKLRDRTTGQLREHDVVLTFSEAHHEVKLAIECRDRSRPIGVNQIEAFEAKCQHTGIARGIMVSTRGYYQSARKKAAHLGIKCLDLEQACSFDWLLAPGVTIIHRLPKHTQWTVFPDQQISEPIEDFRIVNEQGVEISIEILSDNISRRLGEQASNNADPPLHERFHFHGDGLFLENRRSNERIPIRALIADVDFENMTVNAPFDLVKYVDNGTGDEIMDAAVAPISIGQTSGRILILYKPGDKGRVVFLPDSE